MDQIKFEVGYTFMLWIIYYIRNVVFAKLNSAFPILQHLTDRRPCYDIWWSVFVCIGLISQCTLILNFISVVILQFLNHFHRWIRRHLHKSLYGVWVSFYSAPFNIILFNISILITCKRWKRKFLFRATLRDYVRT